MTILHLQQTNLKLQGCSVRKVFFQKVFQQSLKCVAWWHQEAGPGIPACHWSTISNYIHKILNQGLNINNWICVSSAEHVCKAWRCNTNRNWKCRNRGLVHCYWPRLSTLMVFKPIILRVYPNDSSPSNDFHPNDFQARSSPNHPQGFPGLTIETHPVTLYVHCPT